MDKFVPQEEQSFSPQEAYMTRSEVKKLMDDIIKTAVEVVITGVVTFIV